MTTETQPAALQGTELFRPSQGVENSPAERSLREDLRLLAIILLIALIAGLTMGAMVGGAKWIFT